MFRVAITGIGVLTSIGQGKDAFWDGLQAGRTNARPITHFDASEHRVTFAAPISDFEPEVHLGRDARRMDRTVQLGVVAARQVVADAGLDLDGVDREEIGIFTGTCSPMDWVWQQHVAYFTKGVRAVSPFTVLCTYPDAAGAAIAIDLGITGPNMTLSSACSSAADALGHAFHLIRGGSLQRAIAGGVEAPIVPNTMMAFAAARALSTRNDDPTHASRPFDRQRDGFMMGEGAGLVLLERWDLAEARGAHIYGELAGYGATCDAHHMTVPREDCREQARALRLALKTAGLGPEDVDYVNAHGTSTPLNDATETRTLKQVFGPRAGAIPVNSTKSMLGHPLGAAGGIELVATLLQMGHGRVHQTLNLTDPDPECDLDYVPEGPRAHPIEVAVSNSFGFGGKNSVLVVRRARG